MKGNVLFISKSVGMTASLGLEEVSRIFEQSRDLEEIKNAVKACSDRVYATWSSVDVRDKAGEKIPIDEVIAEQNTILERGGTVHTDHSNIVVGKTLSYKIMVHPDAKVIGVLHLNRIFSDNEQDDIVWKEIQSGKRKGTSVGGFNLGVNYEEEGDGSMTKLLSGYRQYEESTVENPANPYALNEAVSLIAKSEQPINKTEVFRMDEEVQKQFETVTKQITELTSLVKENIVEKAKEAEDEPEEKTPEDKPDKVEETKKEEAKGDIKGEAGKEAPASPEPDAPNDMDVVKDDDEDKDKDKLEKEVKKANEEIQQLQKDIKEIKTGNVQPVKKSKTGRPESKENVNGASLNPVMKQVDLAQQIAMGTVKKEWTELNVDMREMQTEHEKYVLAQLA